MLEKLPVSIGHALINQRAGMENVAYNELHRLRQTVRLTVRSSAFVFNGRLPTRFTADGDGVSPPLEWDGAPAEAASIAIFVEDADSPTPHPLVHAIVVNLDKSQRSLPEGALTDGPQQGSPDQHESALVVGQNSFFRESWLPPDPPRGHGEHRYVFQVFALRAGPPWSKTPGRREFIQTVLDRAIAVGCLIGTYERSEREIVMTDENLADVADMSSPVGAAI